MNQGIWKINTSRCLYTDLGYQSFFLHLHYSWGSSKAGSAASPPLAAHCMADLDPHCFQAKGAHQTVSLDGRCRSATIPPAAISPAAQGQKGNSGWQFPQLTRHEFLVHMSNSQWQLLCWRHQ